MCQEAFYNSVGADLVTWCNVSNVCNMSAKNNSDSEYYGRDIITWCNFSNVCNMLAKSVCSSQSSKFGYKHLIPQENQNSMNK